ncbi:MAG: hypothetical protein WA857_08495 [Candidatus Acidiferrum sp.]
MILLIPESSVRRTNHAAVLVQTAARCGCLFDSSPFGPADLRNNAGTI